MVTLWTERMVELILRSNVYVADFELFAFLDPGRSSTVHKNTSQTDGQPPFTR